MKRILAIFVVLGFVVSSPAFGFYRPSVSTSATMHGEPLYAVLVPITVIEQSVQNIEPQIVQAASSIPTCASLNALPAVGQSCSLPIATTDYSLPTSVVQDPGTLGFTSMPTLGSSTYTPIVATGSTNSPVTISVSGACSINDGSVTVDDSGTCTITASQPGADTIQQMFIVGKQN